MARIRTRHPQVSVNDLYLHPTLKALAARLDALGATTTVRREVAPTPRRAALAQALLTVPMLALVGLRWSSVAAAISTVAALLVPWAPTFPWWSLALAWLVLFSPAGRIGIAAGGARLLLREVRPGSHPRGGSVHMRLWAATRLAELSGATGVSSASWTTRYARALGAKIGNDVDLHSAPPVTGLLKIGRGAAVAPEVDLGGYWVDGDVVHIGKIRIGAGATIGSRSTLLPGARIGKGSEIAAGSTVSGAVPAGQRWAGSPARRAGRSGVAWPSSRPMRSRSWKVAYALTSLLLGLLPAVAALPALAIVAVGVAGTASPGVEFLGVEFLGEATSGALLMVAPATGAYLVTYAAFVVAGVRLLGVGMAEGFHPVHSRAGWQVWATERLMGMARTGLFPLYSSRFTAAWLRLLGARIGREVEASTVIALPKMTTVADGAFLADDTMVATYELSGGWLHVAPSRVGKQAFLGNSGMTAPGRSVPNRGLVGVLSATPRKAKKGSSWLGLPPMPLRRAVERGDTSRTFDPPRHLRIARGLIELCRVVPVMCSVAFLSLIHI